MKFRISDREEPQQKKPGAFCSGLGREAFCLTLHKNEQNDQAPDTPKRPVEFLKPTQQKTNDDDSKSEASTLHSLDLHASAGINKPWGAQTPKSSKEELG